MVGWRPIHGLHRPYRTGYHGGGTTPLL